MANIWINGANAFIPAKSKRRTELGPRARILGAAEWLVTALEIFGRPMSTAHLVRRAQERTGLTDFGNASFTEPLEVLTRSYAEEAELGRFGQMTAQWDTLRFLSNLLVLREAEKKNPEILRQSIERPIFITGMPRSGTTFLHNLFSQDPSNRVVRCWETIYPNADCAGSPADPNGRARKVDRQLALFERLAPEIRLVHPMTAYSAQECSEITAHVFRSLRFDTTHNVPTYRAWLGGAGHLEAYRFHQRFLKHLQQERGPGRWILKCPDHVFALDAIRAIYPDACFIFLHRNPLEVLSSVARLTEVLRRPFTRHVDRGQIGKQVSDSWARGAAILVKEAETNGSADSVAHLEFRTFVQDPFRTLATLYRRFGLTFSEELAMRVRGFIAERPNGGYGRNNARLEDYGLDAQAERGRYRDYMACFRLSESSEVAGRGPGLINPSGAQHASHRRGPLP